MTSTLLFMVIYVSTCFKYLNITNAAIFYLFTFFYNQFSKHEPKSKVINSQNIGLMALLKLFKKSTPDLDALHTIFTILLTL